MHSLDNIKFDNILNSGTLSHQQLYYFRFIKVAYLIFIYI